MASGLEITEPLLRSPRGAAGDRVAPQLIGLLDCERLTGPTVRHALGDTDVVVFGRGPLRRWQRGLEGGLRRLDLTLPDRWTSREHARLSRLESRWVLEDAGSTNGTVVNGSVVKRAVLADGDVVEIGHTLFLFRDGRVPLAGAPDLSSDALSAVAPGLATFVASLAERFADLARVARAPVPIAVSGETGTGKELVARAVHALSGRGPLVAVNCGALPATLLQAELFGARRGAVTGATQDRPGLVRSADGGTLFLDEIGDLPAACQVALLRVLEGGEVLPLGESRPVRVDVRVVTATHMTLDEMVLTGAFRTDLYARLSGFALELPPLRDRREDLGLLVAALARRAGGESATLTLEAARLLVAHGWPHNVRELERCITTAVALAGAGPIEPRHLPDAVRAGAAPALPPGDAAHRDELQALLEQHGGNVAAVARALGKGRMQIHRWIERYGLRLDAFRR